MFNILHMLTELHNPYRKRECLFRYHAAHNFPLSIFNFQLRSLPGGDSTEILHVCQFHHARVCLSILTSPYFHVKFSPFALDIMREKFLDI